MQFGLDGTLSLRDPAPWQERAIAQLEHGFPSAGAEQLAVDPSPLARSADGPTSAVGELLRLLAPVLETIVPDEHGVVVRAADAVSPVVATAVIDALTDDGWPAAWLAPDEEPVDPATPVVLLAAHVVPPHLGARCARDDAPHLPLVFTASGAEVGPLVLPGRSACLACLDSHRTAADSAWPVLAFSCCCDPRPPSRSHSPSERRVSPPACSMTVSSPSRPIPPRTNRSPRVQR